MAESKVGKNSTTHQKVGGRQKGTPNKSTEHIFNICKKHDVDPVEQMVLILKNDHVGLGYESPVITKQGFQGALIEEQVITLKDRLKAGEILIGYMYPKRKAIEHTVEQGSTGIVLSYSEESLKKAAKSDEKN